MQFTVQDHHEFPLLPGPNRAWRLGSISVGTAALSLSVALFAIHRADFSKELIGVASVVFCLVAFVFARFLSCAREQQRQTSIGLKTTEREFQSVFENALDAILILDERGACCDANPSTLEMLGVAREFLIGQPVAVFFSGQGEFDASWERLLSRQHDRGHAEIVRADGRHLTVEFSATAHFIRNRHLMVLRDVTQHLQAEEAKTRSLALAKSAWQEADAMRRATLALTQDLRMDYVLDTLLETLHRLVPYQAAQVLLLETESKLFLAREAIPGSEAAQLKSPITVDVSEHPVLTRVLKERTGVVISDTQAAADWASLNKGGTVRSWLGIPLLSSNDLLGLLALAHTCPGVFTAEQLRIACSLALPAAVAIQSARLYARAEIYSAELEHRLLDLNRAEQALEQSEKKRAASEDRFEKVFRSTPIAFSVTSLAEGRFLDVNEAFERRFGYARRELIGSTSVGLGFWEEPHDRIQLIERLRNGFKVRGAIGRFRTKSGDFKASLYAAEMIQLDGQPCLLVVSDDLPQRDSRLHN